VTQLVQDLRVATQELLSENNWADEETKRLVAEKMEAMSVLAGFPEWVSNVSTLDHYYDKVRVADVATARSICSCYVIIVPLLYVQRAVISSDG
jgi:predicted metalloendopeptidase